MHTSLIVPFHTNTLLVDQVVYKQIVGPNNSRVLDEKWDPISIIQLIISFTQEKPAIMQ